MRARACMYVSVSVSVCVQDCTVNNLKTNTCHLTVNMSRIEPSFNSNVQDKAVGHWT